MIPRPARTRRPSTAQAIQSSVTMAVVGTGTNSLASEVATSQPPTWVETSRMPRPCERASTMCSSPWIVVVARSSSGFASAHRRSTDRCPSFRTSRRTRSRTAGSSGGAPSAWQRFSAKRRRFAGRAAHSSVDPIVASPCATPVGSRPTVALAPTSAPRSTRAARGPWPNGASGRGRPSGASRSEPSRAERLTVAAARTGA